MIRNFFYLSLIVMFLSIAFYFVIYIPQRDQMRIEQAEKEQQVKIELEDQRLKNIDQCLRISHDTLLTDWNKECNSRGLSDECRLDESTYKILNSRYEQDRAECIDVLK